MSVPVRVCEVPACRRQILAGYQVCRSDWLRIPAPVRDVIGAVHRRRAELTPELYAATCYLTVAVATTYRDRADAAARGEKPCQESTAGSRNSPRPPKPSDRARGSASPAPAAGCAGPA